MSLSERDRAEVDRLLDLAPILSPEMRAALSLVLADPAPHEGDRR